MSKEYETARHNLVEYLECLSLIAKDLAKDTKEVVDLDDLDCSIMNLHTKLHAISYILGAASAIKNR
jgi:hypothetical protein